MTKKKLTLISSQDLDCFSLNIHTNLHFLVQMRSDLGRHNLNLGYEPTALDSTYTCTILNGGHYLIFYSSENLCNLVSKRLPFELRCEQPVSTGSVLQGTLVLDANESRVESKISRMSQAIGYAPPAPGGQTRVEREHTQSREDTAPTGKFGTWPEILFPSKQVLESPYSSRHH